jgi:hypothetical protein
MAPRYWLSQMTAMLIDGDGMMMRVPFENIFVSG